MQFWDSTKKILTILQAVGGKRHSTTWHFGYFGM
jgi:hypothetical protein